MPTLRGMWRAMCAVPLFDHGGVSHTAGGVLGCLCEVSTLSVCDTNVVYKCNNRVKVYFILYACNVYIPSTATYHCEAAVVEEGQQGTHGPQEHSAGRGHAMYGDLSVGRYCACVYEGERGRSRQPGTGRRRLLTSPFPGFTKY